MKLKHRIIGVAVLLMLASCGKEAGRVPFRGEGSDMRTIMLKPGHVAFWSVMDIEFEGKGELLYTIDLEQGGAKVASVTCDALGFHPAETNWSYMDIGDRHQWRGNAKMDCHANLVSGGSTTVNAKLAFGTKPSNVTIRKADLELRQ
jgi:hypothetical protein